MKGGYAAWFMIEIAKRLRPPAPRKLQWCIVHDAQLQFENEIYRWCLRYNSNHETEGDCAFVTADLSIR